MGQLWVSRGPLSRRDQLDNCFPWEKSLVQDESNVNMQAKFKQQMVFLLEKLVVLVKFADRHWQEDKALKGWQEQCGIHIQGSSNYGMATTYSASK